MAFDVLRGNAASRAALGIAVLLIAAAATLPWWAPAEQAASWMREMVQIACYLIFAMMWNLLAGYGGMVSIGQQACFGFGGYVMLLLGNVAQNGAWRCRRSATTRSRPSRRASTCSG